MPFLFVDYDQGSGGEYFCAELSKSPQCIPLAHTTYPSGRVKVKDYFNQEFLKPSPSIVPVANDSKLYTIIPTHRHTALAARIITGIRSVRIALSNDEGSKATKKNQLSKVLLTTEPSSEHYIGFVRILLQTATSKTFLRDINFKMRNVDLILLAQGISPTADEVDKYIQRIQCEEMNEPIFNYDAIINYTDLMHNHQHVKNVFKDVFGIDIVGDWLQRYANDS